ncbi:MAG TPA: ATP-binding protein [Rhodocyclaceae bacterium]|nr:ATP-binding protein [Rhodocyclaceae bacterium]
MSNRRTGKPGRRKQAEANLQEQYHFMRQLLDTLPNPVFFKDEHGRYLGCNHAFEHCTGIRRKKLIGKSVHDIAPRKLADVYAAADRELFKHPGTQVFETTVNYADGLPRDVVFYKATFSKTDGSLGGLVGIVVDISERKQAEREQLALEAKLRQAQKMESIGHLCGGIAHDFNNILSVILGYTELCRMPDPARPTATIGEMIDEIHLAASRARDLVAQLLAFSRSDEASADTVIVAPIVREVLKLLRSTFPATIAIDVAMDENLPGVRISPVQLHQVLMNLGINARDAIGEKGRMAVRVAAVRLASLATCASCHGDFHGDFVRIAIHDDGRGIRPEDLPRIFEPFFTSKEVGKGSGLGLSVLHGIVHAAGGHIEVDSAPGRGSEFRVYLPAFANNCQSSPGATVDAPQPLPQLTGHVMLVDDEAAIVDSVGALLERAGCTVTSCTDPQAALRRFRANPKDFDLLITDQSMPGLVGTELADACLALRPELPIILCTGSSQAIGAAAESIGIRRLLQKPVAAATLSQLVEELLDGGSGFSPEASPKSPKSGHPAFP